MIKRVISGLIVSVIFIIVLWISKYCGFVVNLSIALITIIAVSELISIRDYKKKSLVSLVSLVFCPVRAFLGPGIKWQTFLYIYTLIIFLCIMKQFIKQKKKKRNKNNNSEIFNICLVYIFTVIISISLGKLVEIRNISPNNIGIFYMFITLGLAWSCDIGAYIMGSYIGRNKLCPCVSSAKTIEGAMGGSFLSLFFVIFSGIVFKFFFNINGINFLNLSFFAILGSPIAILGDLCFSLIKRTSRIKDFSNLIPGHGGILDRFDSVIFTIPYSYIYIHFIPLID